MKITLYYNNGCQDTLEGEKEDLQKDLDKFCDHLDCSFWVYGDPEHFWDAEKKVWCPMVDREFRIYWLSGKTEIVTGRTIQEAFKNHGYGGGAVHGIDWYDTKSEQTHNWDSEKKEWVPIKPAIQPA